MNLRIETESWKLSTNDDGQKVVSGKYVVKCGKESVAEKSFNDDYGGIKIAIPASITAKIEEIDKEICDFIVKSFEK